MENIFEPATLAAVILRVRDVGVSVAWYRDKLGLEPFHVGSDGPHRYAAYRIGGMIVSLWELPAGQERDARDNDRNSYVVVTTGTDPSEVRARLERRGVRVEPLRESSEFRFFWFYDLDNNRFEISAPRTEEAANSVRGAKAHGG